jgi:uncharacterized membrane protein YqiK
MNKPIMLALAAVVSLSAAAGCNEPERQERRAAEARAEANRKINEAQAEADRKAAEARADADKQQAEADTTLRKAREDVREWATQKVIDFEKEFSDLQASYRKKGKAANDTLLSAVRARLDEARADIGRLDMASAQGIDGAREELRDDFDQVRRSVDEAKKAI